MPLTRPLLIAATTLVLAALPAAAQKAGDRTVTPLEIENALDGDANIAGTDAAIEKSDIPMEGAVADTMGEALALDQATDCDVDNPGDFERADGGDEPCVRVDPTATGAIVDPSQDGTRVIVTD